MPKFNVGDVIVPIITGSKDGLTRTVIGHMSNGYVVYEYPSVDGYIRLSSAAETGFKLKPVKKEGWVNIYPNHTCGGGIFDTKEEAAQYPSLGVKIATVKVEWEE